jgi:hypothetical protein
VTPSHDTLFRPDTLLVPDTLFIDADTIETDTAPTPGAAATMYPPFPEDARLAELELQLPPPLPARPPLAGDPEHVAFPMWLRVGLIVCALLLVVVGVAGLVLPGIQGIVTIVAGVALLSLVSSNADRFLRWSLGPWPRILDKVEDMRERSRGWLLRIAQRLADRGARRRGCAPRPEEAGAGRPAGPA